MLTRKFNLVLALFISLFLLASLTQIAFADSRNMDGWEDDPEIYTDDCGFLSAVTLVSVEDAYPGHVVVCTLRVAIDEEQTVDEIHLNLTADSGILFYDIDTSGTEWGGDISDNLDSGDSTTLDLQFYYESGGQTCVASTFLANIKMILSESASFNETYEITHDANFPEIGVVGEPDCVAGSHPNAEITTSDDSVWVWADIVDAYSYQWQDSSSDICKDTLVYVPVYFQAAFPVDTFRFKIYASEIKTTARDTFYINDSYSGLSFSKQATAFTIFDQTSDDAPYPVNTPVYLGEFEVVGRDYRSSYNSDSSYSEDDLISYNFGSYMYFACDSSVTISNSIDSSAGGAHYPVYQCSTFIGNDTVNPELEVEVPVWVHHSFWHQTYYYSITYDTDDLHLTEVTGPGAPFPDVQADTLGTDDNICILSVSSQPDYDCIYMYPDSTDTIFTLKFDVEEEFAGTYNNTSDISFYTATEETYDNWVKDFFHVDAAKIMRYDDYGSDYFYLSDGQVSVPRIFAVSIGDYECTGDTSEIPVLLDWMTSNIYDSLWFEIDLSPTSCFNIVDFDEGGSFSFTNVDFDISKNKQEIVVGFKYSPGEVVGSGVLGYIQCLLNQQGQCSSASVVWDYCKAKRLGTVDATQMNNGTVDECSAKLGVPEIPDDFAVGQNYPNPFNARTRIEFNLPYDTHVKMIVYDIMGRQTRNLVDENCRSGKHIVEWDGKDNTGNTVASGFYFYKMETEDFSDIKKMLLLK